MSENWQRHRPEDAVTPLPTTQLAALFRREIPSLCQEIIDEVCRSIPDYAPLIGGPYREPVQRAVESNVLTFVDHMVSPRKPSPLRDELCRSLGRLQLPFDTGLSRLEAAFRIGVRVAWRRMVRVFRRHRVPSTTQSALADLLFGYVEEMTALARDGYVRALTGDGAGIGRRRRHLARTLLGGHATPRAIAQLAEQASWRLPHELTVVVSTDVPPEAALLDADVLLDPAAAHLALVVPGEITELREQMLRSALGAQRLAVGPTVAPYDAPSSLRWASEALRLATSGAIEGGPLVRSDDHLLRLWVASEPTLGERLRRRQLAPFDALTVTQRRRMLETLDAWLTHRGEVPRIAADLDVHPQTVRYRMRVLRDLVGPALDDPEWRLCTELTLRAGLAREPERVDAG
ncbi:helix-turn-helix domain-containing protein [Nocardioides antri]|uniref:PucR family transcriptional regulator n=1 Tax=Nocardioides antri TaxID=2607659 RepID=A0A5B1LU49_9ACTN|nr:PucR family transcriptional regulator [Nocardioides antri]KAA1423179.1 PucR family transcriptional regulator [Nocardioides antri]